jgi:thymidine kinase
MGSMNYFVDIRMIAYFLIKTNRHFNKNNAYYTMSLEVICGPMFSGKSSHIYAIVKRFSAIGIKPLVVKPTLDNRYSDKPEVITHDGVKIDCILTSRNLMNIPFEATNAHSLIIVEEAQFFNDLVLFVKCMVEREGKDLVVVGLDGDFNRNPFGQILECIPLADKVTKLTAMCVECADGTPALFSYRKVCNGSQIFVGGSDADEPYCRRCYLNAITSE